MAIKTIDLKKQEVAERVFGGDIPTYLTIKSTNKVTVNVNDWNGTTLYEFSLVDVVRYYAKDARNISSGCRTLGKWTGDWRGVDTVAKELLEVFKVLNVEKLRAVGLTFGIEAKF